MKNLTLILLTCLAFAATAQPTNDNCSGAILLTSNTTCTTTSGTVSNATGSYGANLCTGCSCTSPDDKDVYYKFTAVATSHTVTLSNYAANFDGVIELRTACGSGTAIGCYDPSGTPSTVSYTWNNLTIGQTYYIRVFEFNNTGTPPSSSGFSICVTHQQQNCNFTNFSSTSETHGPNAFSTTMFSDDIIMNGQPNCTYTVSESCSWLTITNPSSSPATTNSNGQAFLNYSIQANTTSSARTCTITVNGTPITITQNPCDFDFSPTTKSVVAAGATYSLDVETYSSCSWNIQNSCNWVTLAQSSGTGDATFNVTVAANTTGQTRTCTLSIGNSTHVITQPSVPCTYSVPAGSETFTANGGGGSVAVYATSGCAWTATESCSWVTLSNASGSGDGIFSYTVDAYNDTLQRTCTVTIQGQTFTIIQEGVPNCTYTVSPQTITNDSSGGTQVVTVTVTAGTGCNWSVTENCNWLSAQPASGTGSGSFTLTINPNNDTTTRTCNISITGTGQSITVTQTGKGVGGGNCNETPPAITYNGCALAVPYYANANYEWQWNGQVQQSGTSRFFTVTAITGSGYYTCTVTIGNCTYYSNDLYVEYGSPCIVGVEDLQLSNLSISPNPSTGSFTVSFETEKAETIQLKVYDLLGQLIKQESPVTVSGTYTQQLSLTQMPKGVYMLQIKVGEESISKRIEIQ